MVQLLNVVIYAFLATVKKPLRGFSLTIRSAGRSQGVPFAPFSSFEKKKMVCFCHPGELHPFCVGSRLHL